MCVVNVELEEGGGEAFTVLPFGLIYLVLDIAQTCRPTYTHTRAHTHRQNDTYSTIDLSYPHCSDPQTHNAVRQPVVLWLMVSFSLFGS